jgi:hypothetical protein
MSGQQRHTTNGQEGLTRLTRGFSTARDTGGSSLKAGVSPAYQTLLQRLADPLPAAGLIVHGPHELGS